MQLPAQFMRVVRGQPKPSRIPALQRRSTLSLDLLEDRVQPSAAVDLGAASQFAVLGLQSTFIVNDHANVGGDVGVSQNGALLTSFGSNITGDVEAFGRWQVWGFGSLTGSVSVNPALLKQADADALAASTAAAALAPNKTIQSVNRSATITGNGGLNVIQINGNINASLTLSGTASDVFVINVKGNLDLDGRDSLQLAGGVKAENVIYNFIGRRGELEVGSRSTVNGTLLAPNYVAEIRGVLNGEVIVGGRGLELGRGAKINQVAFKGDDGSSTVADPTIAGYVFFDSNSDGFMDVNAGDYGIAGATVWLSGTDVNGNRVNLSTTTADDGSYSFAGLAAGTYSLSRETPPNLADGTGTIGSVNGAQLGSPSVDALTGNWLSIDGIQLVDGNVGVGYNFAEISPPLT